MERNGRCGLCMELFRLEVPIRHQCRGVRRTAQKNILPCPLSRLPQVLGRDEKLGIAQEPLNPGWSPASSRAWLRTSPILFDLWRRALYWPWDPLKGALHFCFRSNVPLGAGRKKGSQYSSLCTPACPRKRALGRKHSRCSSWEVPCRVGLAFAENRVSETTGLNSICMTSASWNNCSAPPVDGVCFLPCNTRVNVPVPLGPLSEVVTTRSGFGDTGEDGAGEKGVRIAGDNLCAF